MKIHRYLILFSVLFLFTVISSAKDEWTQVQSKNFFLIGNASEKDIRRVGTKLEQFRESFRRLFAGANLTASIPTNVVVFKDGGSYKPFKPKRSDGKADTGIAGYFQPGDDVNYITLSVERDDAETFGLIFHEYVHFIIDTNFGKTRVPQWFNEGLAEYYQTFEIEDDIKIKLGLPQQNHLYLLQNSQLMPLDQMFNATNEQIHGTGGHSRSIFYAQSWALIHFLNMTGRSPALEAFLKGVTAGIPAKTAFETAFQTTYAKMEGELRRYVSQNSYKYNQVKFKEKLVFDTEMAAAALSEAASNAYLGDLLYHTRRYADAEPYLATALKLEPDSSMANMTLGMVKMRQNKWDEARSALEKGIAGDPKNHIAYYQYAYLLSREGRNEFGYVQAFDKAKAEQMRVALRKAIALMPSFTESHELLAFISLVNNDQHDEAIKYLGDALRAQPGNQRYNLRLAEIYSRQNKLDEATATAEAIARTSDNIETRTRAQNLLSNIRQMREFNERRAAETKRLEAITGPDGQMRRTTSVEGVKPPPESQMARLQAEAMIRSINEMLRPVGEGERRVVGRIEKVDCKKRPIVLTVKTDAETLSLTTKDFASLTLISLGGDTSEANVGCDADLKKFTVAATYASPANSIVALEFVPADFRIMTADEMKAAANIVIYDEGDTTRQESPEKRREGMYNAIRNALHKPTEGQRQELGFLEKIECKDKNVFFHIRGGAQPLKLLNTSPQNLKITVYTPDPPAAHFGCGTEAVNQPAVVTYNVKPDAKNKTAGEIVALEFVPSGFRMIQP